MGKGILRFLPAIGTFSVGVGLEMSGIEIPWLGYGLMGLGAVLLIIPLYPYVKRIRLQKPIRLTSGEYEANLKHQAIDYDRRYADWMTVAIQDDMCDLPSCVMVSEPHICWAHLEEREDAYIEFNFDFWSSSVHLLEISRQVQGHICFQGGELERIPEITQEARYLSHLRRSRLAHLKIRQWLSFPVKGRMKTEYGSQVEFDFSKVNISIVATLPDGSQGSTCRFPIPNIISAQMPNHPNAPVPDKEDCQTE